jgi:hypothetical protein
MILEQHLARISAGDITPRIVERNTCTSNATYVAWTPTWEGPPRPDYAAALADLRDRARLPAR